MTGSCHCGRVARRGWHHAYASPEEFSLLRGADALSTYRFGAGTTANYFCSVCGVHTHFYSTYGERPHYAYSLACCEAADLSGLKVESIDGRSF